jgi:hypothetical protein
MQKAAVLRICAGLVLVTLGCVLFPMVTPTVISNDTSSPEGTSNFTDITLIHSWTPTKSTIANTPTFTPTSTNIPSSVDNIPADVLGPNDFPEHINPLTGQPADSPELLDRRPCAVKISNGPRGIRPQWGLSFADHVFEYYQESGRTRFNAIFYGQNASIAGPIRSARFLDEEIIRMYKSTFAFGSADARVRERLFDTGFGNRFAMISDSPCPPTVIFPLCRTDPNGYNHLITDTSVLSEFFTQNGVDNTRQNLNGFSFQPLPPDGGFIGNSLSIRYSTSYYNRWDYDSDYDKYFRYQDSADDHSGGSGEKYEILTDRLTGKTIRAANIVVLLTNHSYFLRNPEMWEISLIGNGQAYVFRDGFVFEVNWTRTREDDMILLTHPDGGSFPLKPGKTWFQIIGTSSAISNDESIWRFEHLTP